MQKVDILLPIYNSYSETKNCIDAILLSTPQNTYNLFLLDDKSPDENIKVLTESYSKDHDFILSYCNDENLGFPGNVNNGFAISANDVVVLNSDTIVSEGWLNKLAEAAYSEKEIAAVNPMSNYGIISGIPTPNTEINELFSFDEILKAFQKSNEKGYVDTPLLTGFCMYMKRDALHKVGNFDAATFKRGYGEESDWCIRARQKGFKLIVTKEAYVHHIGGISFGVEKEVLRQNSKVILLNRYPEIDAELEEFVVQNHFKKIRKSIIKQVHFLTKKTNFKTKLKMIKHYFKN